MSSQLSIYIFIPLLQVAQSINSLLSDERYDINEIATSEELRNLVQQNEEQIDCLIVLNDPACLKVLNEFYEQGTLLPLIILDPEDLNSNSTLSENENQEHNGIKVCLEQPKHLYHNAEIRLRLKQLEELPHVINRAITQFLHLGPTCYLLEKPKTQLVNDQLEDQENFLLLQQRRLAEKLKERLGYLGVYYNRNPKYFYRHLSPEKKSGLLKELSQEYQGIILHYFEKNTDVNQEIDQFVNRIFFADISVSEVLEIHMELMDKFSQKLKLEGRSEEILLDYRLALIDIIAHLCEMYRRSIPREDLPFDVLFPID